MNDLAISNTSNLSRQISAQNRAEQTGRQLNRLDHKKSSGLKQAAKEFEAVFISQMLSHMWSGIKTDGPFSGGRGEQIFRDMMIDEYGKEIAKSGQLGLSDQIMAQLLQHQEQR
jgi:Rod binding domain-containing protein